MSLRWLYLAAMAIAVLAGRAPAQDNIDPLDQGSQHAWAENAGWMNAEPRPPGGALPGIVVADAGLRGYAWMENVGWVSLSCQNTVSCGTVSYGVANDGNGTLSGFAWGENVGWIDFRPAIGGVPVPGAGVRIDPVTGFFSGHAWAENLGWIRFSFDTPALGIFQIRTAWRGPVDLGVTKTDGQTTAVPGQPVVYTIVVSNAGPSAAPGATVIDTPPPALLGVSWTCTASPGSSCPASGVGAINHAVTVAVGGTLTYTLSATLSPSATGTLVNTASVTTPAGVPDPNIANNSATDTDTIERPDPIEGELIHGMQRRADLAAAGGPDQDLFRLRQQPYASYEVVVDEASGDVGSGQGPALDRVASDGSTVIQPSVAVGTGPGRTLRWMNTTGSVVDADLVRVRSASCGTGCGPDDVYRIRAYETTGSIPRFNNSGDQVSVLILQNPGTDTVSGRITFWTASGTLLLEHPFGLAPRASMSLNTWTLPALAGQGGSVTVMHDGRHGVLVGKVVALDLANGFAFDSLLEVRPR